MINRVLIRIKVIQILYASLLVEKAFNLETSPSAPTKEKRFAYHLYMDMLVLMIKIADAIVKRGGDRPLRDTRFISRLLVDDQIKALLGKYRVQDFPFESCVVPLADELKESAIYKNYLKNIGADVNAGETIWNEIFRIIIMPDPAVSRIISERDTYTLKGVERMQEMMETTFGNFMASQDSADEVQSALRKSLEMSRDLYFRLLALPMELTYLEERQLDESRYKYLVTDKDLNPDLRFVENRLVADLKADDQVMGYISKKKLNWLSEEPVMMNNLLRAIKASDIYKEYMAAPNPTAVDDYELWRNLYKKVVLCNANFLETLEEKSVFWNDDLDILSTFVQKTFKRFEDGDRSNAVLPQFKDNEDARFGAELINYVLKNKEKYRSLIDEAVNTSSWDVERLAFMDVVILETALAEILNFPKIPLTVSVNEYIEIAKSYSGPKSGSFVHGILGAIISKLQQDNVLLKK